MKENKLDSWTILNFNCVIFALFISIYNNNNNNNLFQFLKREKRFYNEIYRYTTNIYWSRIPNGGTQKYGEQGLDSLAKIKKVHVHFTLFF